MLFESDTHKKPTFSDLYLIHQQGWQGAAEHVNQPDRIAWKSMCATNEGRQKGEKWCKRAIWQNTLPTIKHVWKSVDKLTSGAFVDMWLERVDRLYARYAEPIREDLTVHEETHKFYFMIIDFRGATGHFADPDFDGEPVQIYEPGESDSITPPDDVPTTGEDGKMLSNTPGADEIIVDGETPNGSSIVDGPKSASRRSTFA